MADALCQFDFAQLADQFDVSGVDTGTDVITLSGAHGWLADAVVMISTTDTLPAPLTADTMYYVKAPSGADLQLAATAGGAAINLTSAGVGTHTIINSFVQGNPTAEAFATLDIVCRIYDSDAFEDVLGYGAVGKGHSVETDTPSEDIRDLAERSLEKGGIV